MFSTDGGRNIIFGLTSGRRPDPTSLPSAHLSILSKSASQPRVHQFLLLVDFLLHYLFVTVSHLREMMRLSSEMPDIQIGSIYRGRSKPLGFSLTPSAQECLVQASLINGVQTLSVHFVLEMLSIITLYTGRRARQPGLQYT